MFMESIPNLLDKITEKGKLKIRNSKPIIKKGSPIMIVDSNSIVPEQVYYVSFNKMGFIGE